MKPLPIAAILILFATSAWVRADDTDVYVRTTADQGVGDAYVMLGLDWRPNLGSSACPDELLCPEPGTWVEQCSGTYVGGVCDGTLTQVCLDTSTDPDTAIEPITYNECEDVYGEFMPERDFCTMATDVCVDALGNTTAVAADGSCPDGWGLVAAGDPVTQPVDGLCPAGTTLEDGDYTFFHIIVAALRQTLEPLENIHLGLMMSHTDTRESGDACSGPNPPRADQNCANGAFIFSGFKDMDVPEQREEFFRRLLQIPIPAGNEAHPYQGREMYLEFYRYLTGQRVYNGHNGWGDYGTDNDQPPYRNIDDPLDVPLYVNQQALWPNTYPGVTANGSWDKTIEEAVGDGTYKYISPLLETGECPTVFVVNLMHQVSQQEVESDDAIAVEVCPNGSCANVLDGGLGLPKATGSEVFPQIIRWFVDAPQLPGDLTPNGVEVPTIRSFFLVDESKVNDKTTGYAQAGLTQVPYTLSSDPEKLKANLTNVFSQILSTSSTFVTPTMPVNVFNRAQSLGSVFLSIFEAAEAGTPQWSGNLKMVKLQFNEATGTHVLIDQNGNNAVGPDGRLAPSALTYWTIADELAPPEAGETDFLVDTDGRGVRRGAAGQVMPGARDAITQTGPGLVNPIGSTTSESPRRLFTEPSSHTNGTADALLPFNATAETAQTLIDDDPALSAMLTQYVNGTADATDTAQSVTIDMMKHARGIDVMDEDGDGLTDDARPWLFGDALHGPPFPINYGSASEADPQEVRVMMTNNDGWVRMFGVADDDGVEDWAFMPRAVIPKLKRLMDNSPGIDPLHPYLVDGTISMLMIDNDGDTLIETADGDRVIAVFGQRRGGKNYWALDVSDPDDPRLLWSIGKGASCDPLNNDICEIAQTWSTLRPTRLLVDFDEDPANPNPQEVFAFIFSGGYKGDDDGDRLGELGKDERTSLCTGTEQQICDGSLGCSDGTDPVGGVCAAPATLTCDVGFRTACIADATGAEISYQTELLGSDDNEGNAIFIVDALTGELIWKAVKGAATGATLDNAVFTHTDLNDSIPAEVTMLDSDADRRLDRFYVADTGGVLWRGDLASALRSGWTLTKVASVGRHYADVELPDGATITDDRRFFPRADVVRASDAFGDYDGIVIASGDRAHPLGTAVENYAYLFKDRNTISGIPPNGTTDVIMHDDVLDLTDNCLDGGDIANCSTDAAAAQAQLDKGWRIKLEQCEDLAGTGSCGEKGLSNPLVVQGIVMFNTYVPPTEGTVSCAPKEGEALLYAVSLDDAAPVLNFNETNDTNGVTLDRFDKINSGGIAGQLQPVGFGDIMRSDLNFTNIPGFSGAKTFWYEEDRGGAASGL